MTKPSTSLTDSFRTLKDNLNQVSNNVGDPANLATTHDSDLVGAINEVFGLVGADSNSVGNLNGLNDSYFAGADSSVVAALNKIYEAQWEKYRSVTEYGVQAGDSAYGDSNSLAIKDAIAAAHPLYWPSGTYYFSEAIRVNQNFRWKGVGGGSGTSLIVPTLDFTDSSLVHFEYGNNSAADNDTPSQQLIDCKLEGLAFNAGGLANGTRAPVTSIRQCWYINWMHQSTFEDVVFQNFNGTDSTYAIRMVAHNDKSNSGGAFSMNVRMRDFHIQNCANGIQVGGLAPTGFTDDNVTATGDVNANQFENMRIGGWQPTDGPYTGVNHGKGVYFAQGYDNTLQGANIEIFGDGITNNNYVNYAITGLTEQCNNSIIQNDSGHLSMLAMNTVPAPPSQDYHRGTHLSWRGWGSQMATLGSPENLLVDGTFETNLYESATLGASIVPIDGGSNTDGGTGRNLLYLPVTANPADIRWLVKPNKRKLRGWHTVLIRAKRATLGANSTLFFFVTPSHYTESIGVSQGGSGTSTTFAEIGEFGLTALRNQTNYLDDEFKIYMGSFYFDDVEVDGFNGRAINSDAYVDWVALYEGTVAAIPQPSLEFEVTTDVVWGGGSGTNNTNIFDFHSAGTTAKPLHVVGDFIMYQSHYDSDGESLHAAFQVINGTSNFMTMGPFKATTGRYYNSTSYVDSAGAPDSDYLQGNPRSLVYLDNLSELFYTTYAGVTVLPTQKAVAKLRLMPNQTAI